jgi:hypothetical protein
MSVGATICWRTEGVQKSKLEIGNTLTLYDVRCAISGQLRRHMISGAQLFGNARLIFGEDRS